MFHSNSLCESSEQKAMEGNKDEAERCIELAEHCLLEGKRDKAERFLQKSERLFPTQKAKGKQIQFY